ncbi:MAG: PKD domain-containing protein [Labilithrix sp.]|nr:PKD domain-containing protein [Labilithrix sp.]
MTSAIACGGSDAEVATGPVAGAERGPCFANGTCNAGLQCLSSTCVAAGSSSSSSGSGTSTSSSSSSSGGQPPPEDAGKDADAAPQKFNDAGDPCPGAVIFHPGTETRDANTSVPFSGRGRDANCVPITGAKLVWTDSIGGGTIGTGETFNHTFTVKGSHTITLTSTDGAGASTTATVTFTIQ